MERLQLGVAGDVDLVELERQLRPHLVERRPRTIAEVAPVSAVEDDARGYG
jgi:predicted Zn-dependent peptidase